jgi:hypothetical protein
MRSARKLWNLCGWKEVIVIFDDSQRLMLRAAMFRFSYLRGKLHEKLVKFSENSIFTFQFVRNIFLKSMKNETSIVDASKKVKNSDFGLLSLCSKFYPKRLILKAPNPDVKKNQSA